MKNKSTRHKTANTFKFQPFAERIANINVDIFHQVGHEYEEQTEEEECFFFQAIQKWNVLNLTEGYEEFRKDVRPHNILTLPQLIHHKERCVEVLLKHLQKKNVLCLQPLLEMVVALAKDLRKDFYPFYPQFLEVLLDLLNTKDTDQLEWTFTCLAYIFKFLWRVLVKDINTVFSALLPLLSDSKPVYINEFAAESFSFVARKVKDKKAFLTLVIKSVRNHKDGVSGCSKLLFEVINGVNGQFHSSADQIIPLFLESITDEKLIKYGFLEVLQLIIQHVVENIQPQKSELFWNSFRSFIQTLSNDWLSKQESKTLESLHSILKLGIQVLQHKEGKFVYCPKQISDMVLDLYQLKDLPEDSLLKISEFSVLFLISKNVKHSQEDSSKIVRKSLSFQNENLLHYVTENTFDYPMFKAWILPKFLENCVARKFESRNLEILTKIILKKAPFCNDGINFAAWSKYSLDFGKDANDVESMLLENISLEPMNLKKYLCTILILPNLNLSRMDFVEEKLLSNIKHFLREIEKGAEDNLQKTLFLLLLTLESNLHIFAKSLDHILDDILKIIMPLGMDTKFILALKIVDLYFSQNKNFINIENLNKIHSVLESNLLSPYHEIRLVTAHIYSLFNYLNDLPSTENEKWNIFEICYKVESTTPQVDTYRDILSNLEKFTFEKAQYSLCKDTIFKLLPLKYLCGVLYINFQLIWDPVLKLIATHAEGLSSEDFWSVFGIELKKAVGQIKTPPNIVNELTLNTDFISLEDMYKQLYLVESKPDFINYRLLLWKGMLGFPDVAESKNRDVVDLFLTFMSEEYLKSNSETALTWNIKQNSDEQVDKDVEMLPADEEKQNEDEDDIIKKQLTLPLPKNGLKNTVKALLQHMKIFTKVRSPKSMYKEPELYKLYFDFLSHKNPEIQKTALDCILTYKHKYLVPYKENLYNLIDDKNFKNELATFRVDQESPVVLPEHRENLIPIVMKILFSKMSVKTGLRTGGKSSGQMRRSLVLRFLASCDPTEMLKFIEMAFKYYANFIRDNPEDIIEELSEEKIDLEKFIPPKRLQSTVNLLNVVLDQFGQLMSEDILGYLVKILLIIGCHVKSALSQNSSVHVGFLSSIKVIRNATIKILEKFFKNFEKYPWGHHEVNAIFRAFVWPYIEKLSIEGIHSPTPLLKLASVWAENPRYFRLLIKCQADSDENVLLHVIKLLESQKVDKSVSSLIFEMIQNLLKLEEDEEDLETKIDVGKTIAIENKEKFKMDNLNFGSQILLKHVYQILSKIRLRMGSKKGHIHPQELFILSRISELVYDSDISDSLLELLLPIMHKKCTLNGDEQITINYMLSLKNLIEKVESPKKHIRMISPLFGQISLVEPRKILCQIIDVVCNKHKEDDLVQLSSIINELNSWDKKWVDQPDYQTRLDAFRKIQKISEEPKINIDLGALIIYNCYYFISSEKDLSLKENASHILKLFSVSLIKNSDRKNADYILNEIILNLIRTGMKSKNRDLRDESILLLGHLSKECSDLHVVFRDLSKLADKNDPEVDFFENLVHLQVHRHGRALLKFVKVFSDQETAPSMRTLTQFILPLASNYLLNQSFASKNSIIDAAIEAISLICKLLPWPQYERVLRVYLDKLRYKVEFQKQLVRLVVVILDSFHFDLNKGFIDDIKKEIRNEENRETSMEVDPIVESSENVGTINEPKDAEEKVDEDETIFDDLPEEDKQIVEETNDIEALSKNVKACEKVQVLSQSSATKVITIIQSILLPKLHRSLAVLTQFDSSHKVNRKKTAVEREDEDLLKVPISLAVVKLLQKLPKGILETNLAGIFMKICTFLKSQLESVRRTARETLQKIMLTVGTEHLPLLIREVTPLMTRGYQVHVLVYTVHAVLHCLKDFYKSGDMDKVLLTILSLCQMDLFGTVSEEKEVTKIGVRISEAKSSKSVDIFLILAQYISESCLMDLLLPLKEILMTTHSYKTVVKAQECLRQIALGLVDNKFVHTTSLIKFSYGISSESIPQLKLGTEKPNLSEAEREKLKRQKEDCFIIPKAPVGKTGIRLSNVKSSMKTNAHIIVEFGLRLCYFLLKRDKLQAETEEEFFPLLNPFAEIFKSALKSNHVKLSTVTLQCLGSYLKYELQSMKDCIKDVTESIFAILHKYAASGLSKGDNFDLVAAAFKTMSILVRDVKYHTITTDQLKILLLYVEQDLYNGERQSIAFNLLKAIINRKLIIPEIHDVLAKVAQMSITSDLDHVRAQSRMVFHQYLMDYPLGNKLDHHIAFYMSQLKYELQYGRESALEMVQSLIYSFPLHVLKNQSGTFLINLGARLLNDDVPACRKQVAHCISQMFSKLPKVDRDPLFDIILLWMKDRKVTHRHMGCQLIGLLVSVEKSSFETRIPTLMPVLMLQFDLNEEERKPGKFVAFKEDSGENEEKERLKDHHLFQALQMCLKISASCPNFLKQEDEVEKLGNLMQMLLSHPHEWVRLAAAQFLGYILTTLDIEKLQKLIQNKESESRGFLYCNPVDAIRSLTLDLCDQLQPGVIKSNFAEQVIKNLVFIARVLPVGNEYQINLLWLTKRLRKAVNREIVETSQNIVVRQEVFKWIGAIVSVIDIENTSKVLNHLMGPLVREMVSTEESNAPLRQLAKEVGKIIKNKIGLESYTKVLASVELHLNAKRSERKRKATQLAVTDAEAFAKKKLRKQEKKKEKRKISKIKKRGKKPSTDKY